MKHAQQFIRVPNRLMCWTINQEVGVQILVKAESYLKIPVPSAPHSPCTHYNRVGEGEQVELESRKKFLSCWIFEPLTS